MSSVDWQKIKAEYLQGGTSYRKLAEKYEVSFSTLKQRAIKEKWANLREDVCHRSDMIAQQKIVSQRVEDIASLERSRSVLISKLEKAIEKFPDVPGNRMEQTITEIIAADTGSGDGKPKKKIPKQKTVRFESDLMKMVSALDKLMEMTGYVNTDDSIKDDGFLDALNAEAMVVTENDADIPEDL